MMQKMASTRLADTSMTLPLICPLSEASAYKQRKRYRIRKRLLRSPVLQQCDGRFLSPDWSAKAEPVPYSKLGNPQSLNLYGYMRNDPLGRVDPDGHRCESDFDSLQTPEQKNWQPNTEFDRQFSTTVAKISVGVLAIASTDGAAAG